jgi:hypothetical protein
MPRVPGADEYQQGGSDFGTLEADEYRVKVDSWEEKDNVPNKFNPEGKGKSIWFKLRPLFFEHDQDADLVDEDGNPLNPDKTLIFFYDPQRLGLVPRIAKSRKFLAAALNVPIEEPIEFDSYDELVGKEMVASVIVKDGKNRIDDVRPVKNRKARAAAKAKTPVEAAKEVFGEDANEPEDDTDY